MTWLFPFISGAVLLASGALCTGLLPGQRGALAPGAGWQMLLLLLLADDFTQYLWHRLSHSSVL